MIEKIKNIKSLKIFKNINIYFWFNKFILEKNNHHASILNKKKIIKKKINIKFINYNILFLLLFLKKDWK